MEIEPGVWRHNRTGRYYNVLGIGIHTESQEPLVVYERNGMLWIRPLEMFTEEVGGKPRFELVARK